MKSLGPRAIILIPAPDEIAVGYCSSPRSLPSPSAVTSVHQWSKNGRLVCTPRTSGSRESRSFLSGGETPTERSSRPAEILAERTLTFASGQ